MVFIIILLDTLNFYLFIFKFNIKKLDSTNITLDSNNVKYNDNYITFDDNNWVGSIPTKNVWVAYPLKNVWVLYNDPLFFFLFVFGFCEIVEKRK